jgi:hypothetical protein
MERDPRYDRVVHSIVRTGNDLKVQLRPDAVFFLANNIIDMVFNPMRTAGQRHLHLETAKIASEEDLFSDIDRDLPTIIESTSSVADERERSELSSASVIVGLGRVIDRLRINRTKLWGRRFETKV